MLSTYARLRTALIATITLAPAVVHGAVMTWDSPAGGYFLNGSNWVGGVAPSAADSAMFDQPAAAGPTVWFANVFDTAGEYLTVENGTWIFDMSGRTYDLASTSLWPGTYSINLAPSGGDTTLYIKNGTMSGVHAEMSFNAASSSWLTIRPDAQLALAGLLRVGVLGDAVMSVDGTASLGHAALGTASSGFGQINVDDAGLLHLDDPDEETVIGDLGNGAMYLLGGGTLDADGPITLGRQAGSDGVLDIQGGILDASAEIVIGDGGPASMSVTLGGQADVASIVIGADGSLRVDGPGSRCTIDGSLTATGDLGTRVMNAALLEVENSVDLSGSAWLWLDGGTLRTRYLYAPPNAVDIGPDSTLHLTEDFAVFANGPFDGELSLVDRAALIIDGDADIFADAPSWAQLDHWGASSTTAGDMFLGLYSGEQGEIIVEGKGDDDASAIVEGTLFVGGGPEGPGGLGEATVLAGGTLDANRVVVYPGGTMRFYDESSFVTSEMIIDGGFVEEAGSAFMVTNDLAPSGTGLFIDGRAPVSLTVQNGGDLVTQFAHIGTTADAMGAATIADSSWTVINALYLGSDSFEIVQAHLEILQSGYVLAGNHVELRRGSTLHLAGTGTIETPSMEIRGRVTGNGTIEAAVEMGAGGVIAPGNSPGLIDIDGPNAQLWTFAGSSIEIELAGPNASERDRIHVNGAVDLNGGTLKVTTIDGFAPAAGQIFEIITSLDPSAGVSGEFDAIEPADAFAVIYTDNAVLVEVLASCAGDLDGSGHVGFDDLLNMLNAWGPCPAPCQQDVDGSGHVGFDDVTMLLNAWGTCP